MAQFFTADMTREIRIRREAPVDDVTTTLSAHPVCDGGTEIVVEQTKFVHFKKKYAPTKLLFFTLSPKQRRDLIALLEEQDAVQKRSGRDVSANEEDPSPNRDPERAATLPRSVAP